MQIQYSRPHCQAAFLMESGRRKKKKKTAPGSTESRLSKDCLFL